MQKKAKEAKEATPTVVKFGVLMVTTSNIYFFEETPGNWSDIVLEGGKLNTDQELSEFFKGKKEEHKDIIEQSDKFLGGHEKNKSDDKGDKSDKPCAIELKRL